MASEEHKELAGFLKEVHLNLRKSSTKVGAEQAWHSHCENKSILKKYAQCMEKLATVHWSENSGKEKSEATSRIKWAADFIYDYFVNKSYARHRQKEIDIASKINIEIDKEETFSIPIKLLDVGSCYNPFKVYDYLDVTAIDLCPANSSVLECDFLNVSTGLELQCSIGKLEQLPLCYFSVVTFCFLLEYIPTSNLRIKACETAYSILKPGGLLIINTPDSKHVGANSRIMKCWQFTLAKIGFTRIKYEKFKHMHCIALRKAVCRDVATRWAQIHDGPNMEFELHIPQDFNINEEEQEIVTANEIKATPEDFSVLPFST